MKSKFYSCTKITVIALLIILIAICSIFVSTTQYALADTQESSLDTNDFIIPDLPEYVEVYSQTRDSDLYNYEKTAVIYDGEYGYVKADFYRGPKMFLYVKQLTGSVYWEGESSKVAQQTLSWSQEISVATTNSHSVSVQIGLKVPIKAVDLSIQVGYQYTHQRTYTVAESQSHAVVLDRTSPQGYYCLSSFIDANLYGVKVSTYSDKNCTQLIDVKENGYLVAYNTTDLAVKYRYKEDTTFSAREFLQ